MTGIPISSLSIVLKGSVKMPIMIIFKVLFLQSVVAILNVLGLSLKVVLQNLKEFKAYGPNKVPNCLLKECVVEISPSLTLLFQASINQSVFPTEWKHALVTPVFKKGDYSLPSNYQPVSLTCVCD